MTTLIDWFYDWAERVSRHIEWLAPLFARFIVGWDSPSRGVGRLHNLSAIVPDFADWPIPSPQILSPFVLGVEFFGGMFLLIGLLTRISVGADSVTVDRRTMRFTRQAQR
jgi:putative oxidoreductase